MDALRSPFDGLDVAFTDSGAGSPALVLIHGLIGDHSDFDPQVEFFAETNRVVAIDLPGAGRSGRLRSTWTVEALGEDVAGVVEHLGLDDVVLVGYSLGGNVTVETARRLPGRVRALVWVSSFRSLDAFPDASHLASWFAPFEVDFPAAMDDLTRRNFGPDADPDLVDAAARGATGIDEARGIGLLRSKFAHASSVVEAIRGLGVPIFAINPDLKPNDAASFARHDIELTVIEGVGHFVPLEAPEALSRALAAIVKRLGSGTVDRP